MYAINEFSCVNCKFCKIGKTKGFLVQRMEETCVGVSNSASDDYFETADSDSFRFRLQFKQAMYIFWKKPKPKK